MCLLLAIKLKSDTKMYKRRNLFPLLFLMSILIIGVQSADPKLRKKLLENYDPMAQPYPAGIAVTTTVTMSSLNVIHYNIDDKEQTLEIHAWLYMNWNDERLRWSQYNRDQRGYLHFKKSEIWRPDITLYNTAKPKAMDDFADEAHILVKANGSTIWVPPIRFVTNCQMNLLRWPFDTQDCHIKLGSWTFSEHEVDLQLGPSESALRIMSYEGHNFANNTEWDIVEASAVRKSRKYACCEENYVDVTYYFKLARKYGSYAYTVIFPVIMISVISVLNFLLPYSEMSRVLLGCFNFLTIAAYLIYFRLRLPTIDHVPYIVKLFVWNLFVTTVNLILIIILRLISNSKSRNGKQRSTPEWVKATLDSRLGAILLLGQTPGALKNGSDQAQENAPSENHNKNTEDDPNQSEEKVEKGNDGGSLTSDLIDRFGFLVFAFLTIIMLFYHLC